MPMQHMKTPESARCHASTIHLFFFKVWLSAMPMQHMKAPESAQCYASTRCENFQTIAQCHANAT